MINLVSLRMGSGCGPSRLSSARLCRAMAQAGVLAAVSLFLPGPASAQTASQWIDGPLSRVRIINGGAHEAGLRAGVEIMLKGGAHTYWRNPGDGGIPPVFDFAGSTNLKSASVNFPAPKRSGEAGAQIFGYEGEVVFPLSVIPVDPAQPVKLAIHLSYAACEKICMPAEARMSLTLSAREADKNLAARIAAYADRVPVPVEQAGARAPQISLKAMGGKLWRLDVKPAPGGGADMFAEGPEGWFFDTKPAGDGVFDLVLAEQPPGAPAGQTAVTLTLTTGKGGFVVVKHLDVAAATP